jgi:hypothetical protein
MYKYTDAKSLLFCRQKLQKSDICVYVEPSSCTPFGSYHIIFPPPFQASQDCPTVSMTIPLLLIIRQNFLPPLTSAANVGEMVMQATCPLAVCCLVSDPTNKTMPPFRSLLRAMWGFDIITIVAAGSIIQSTSTTKRVPNNSVGKRIF